MLRRKTQSSSKMPGLKVTGSELAKDGALKFGSLWKAGAVRKTMHQRFFVLRPSCYLFYFKKSTDTAPAGVVEVNRYTTKLEDDITDGEDGYKYPFKIQNATDPDSERIFHLEASSAAERKQWFDAFEKMARLNDTMRGGGNVLEEQKAEIADLKDRLADKTAALNAARAVASNAASGGSGGSDATASYRAEIASLEARLEASKAEIVEANNRADAIEASALASATAAAAGDDSAAAAALAAKDQALAAKDKEIAALKQQLDADRAAVDGVLQHLTTVAAALGYALGKRKKLSKMDQLAKAAQDIQKMVKRYGSKRDAEVLAAKAEASAAKASNKTGRGKKARAGAGAGAGAGGDSDDDSDDSGDDALAGAKPSARQPPPQPEKSEPNDFSLLRQKTKSKVLVKELDRLPPPWFPDHVIRACQMCARGFGMFRRKHHCRRCGRCVCSSCAPEKCMKTIPEFGYKDKVRHCVDCFDLFAI